MTVPYLHKDLRLNMINLLNTNLDLRYIVKVLFNYAYAFKIAHRKIKALSCGLNVT